MSGASGSDVWDRRAFLRSVSLGALAIGVGMPRMVGAATLPPVLDRIFEQRMELYPEHATELGLDIGSLAPLRGRLNDYSPAGRVRAIEITKTQLALLNRSKSQIGPLDDKIVRAMLVDVNKRAQFAYASLAGFSSPYPISPLTGPYQSAPDLFDRQQPLETEADGKAYLERLRGLGPALDQSTASFLVSEKANAALPSFLVATTLVQLRAMRPASARDSIFVQTVVRRSSDAHLSAHFAEQALAIVQDHVHPALDRQIAALAAAAPNAPSEAGVWRLPQGDDYYRVALATETTTDLTPEQVHAIGQEEVTFFTAALDKELALLGLTTGTVIERLDVLASDPKNYYDNSEAGRSALLETMREQIAKTYLKLPSYFSVLPTKRVEARRVPAFQEAGYPGGSYLPAPPDGSRPALFSMNLGNMHDRPSYGFPTLAFHESVPGHHLQIGLVQELTQLSPIRRYGEYSAYTEGWAVYAETLGAEMKIEGLGPLATVGYLQSMLFRAARLIVDTGLHWKRWSRDAATDALVSLSGLSRPRAVREIDRYCVFPGQACSYMIGYRTWIQLRDEARQREGTNFDIREFHKLLEQGALPLTLLEEIAREHKAAGA